MIKSKLRRTRKIRSRRTRRTRKFKSRRLRRTRKLRITRKKISKNMKLKKYGGVSCRGHSEDEFFKRFVDAQKKGYKGNSTRKQAIEEIKSGKKGSCWIWYIFPSMFVSGVSLTSERFSIPNLETAIAYLEHPELGKNLIDDLKNLYNKFYYGDITKFFSNNADIPKFISCILLFYVAVKSRPIEFNDEKYDIFNIILAKLLNYKNTNKNLNNLGENLTIKTIFEDYPNLILIKTKQQLDEHIRHKFKIILKS